MKRQVITTITQTENSRRKTAYELFSDLTNRYQKGYTAAGMPKYEKPLFTQTKLAKELGISPRHLSAIKNNLKRQSGYDLPTKQYERNPSKDLLTRLSKVASKYKVRKTVNEYVNILPNRSKDVQKNIINRKTREQLLKVVKHPDYFGVVIRVNVSYYSKNGVFDNWVSFSSVSKNVSKIISDFLEEAINSKMVKLPKQGSEIFRYVIKSITIEVNSKKIV